MAEEKKKKVTREVKLEGRPVERLVSLHARKKVLEEQQATLLLELERIRGGMDAIMQLNEGPGEKADTFNFDTQMLTIEVASAEPKPEGGKPEKG